MQKLSLLLACLAMASLPAAEIIYTGVEGGEWATNANWSTASYPSGADYATLDTTANLSVVAPNSIRAIRIGTSGSGTLNIASQATLDVGSHASWDSHLGDGSGNHGTVHQEGGFVDINELEIGRNSSTGVYHLQDGSLTIIRGLKDNSLYLGTDDSKGSAGEGHFIIRNGEFKTRVGVYLGSASGGIGHFEVIGSHANLIGIGSHGNGDGSWTQNSGSTLKVQIDKTTQGLTPIFIDEVGDDGDGNVVFEDGSLLDVSFTTNFVNGGTYTVMEWEGEVTDNGLQFAPSVDTNIWSFQVDAANKRLTVTAAAPPLARNFVHPGLSHKLSDLERMRDMVAAGEEPYASTFAKLSSTGFAQHTYQPSSAAADLATNGGTANNNALRNDGVAAYFNALMWFITGDERHAEASIRIFTAWSGVKNIDGIPLNAGRHWRLIEAAEIIKSTYNGWEPADLQAFKDMLVYPGYSSTTAPTGSDQSLYWRAYQGDPARHGNQGLFALRVVMAIGVFLDNEVIYDRAVRYLQGAPARADDLPYETGPSIANQQIASYEHFNEFSRTGQENTIPDYGYNEVIHNYIWPNGQGQEFSRDMAHGLAGISIICTMAEMAWSQGDDLYGHLDNRPLRGLEYFYRYNVSYENSYLDQTSSWEPTVENGEFIQRLDRSGRWFSLKANPYLAQNVGETYIHRGRTDILEEPVYEMNLAHYRDRMGVPGEETKWLERGQELLTAAIGVEDGGTAWDHPSFGSLTFHRVSPGDPVQGFSNGSPDFAMNVLPMTIEAENFDYFVLNEEEKTYSDLSTGNSGLSYRLGENVDLSSASVGDYAVSDIEAGEWLSYTISVPADDNYDLSILYSSTAPGGTIQFSVDGTDLTGEISIPHGSPDSTGASDWKSLLVAADLPLTQGVQQLRITFGGTSQSFLLNSFSLTTPIPDPVAHWRFDEGAGSLAYDCSGNDFHGTINNPSWTTRPDGGNALAFDGNSTNVTLPSSAFASLTDEVTLAFWAFGDEASLPTETVAFFAGNSGGGRILNIHLPWSTSEIYWDASDRISKAASEAEFEGSWTHWAFTKDANEGTMKIFRNGILWHSGTGKTNSIGTIAQAYIGSENTSRHYSGLLDDFRLFDTALSDATISTLYTNALSSHLLTYSAGPGGSLSGVTSQTVDHTTNGCPVTAIPDLNFTFVDWSDGSTENPRTDLFLTGDLSVTANFVANYTALENWRFLRLGTYENSGIAADDFDADGDGLPNLIEYATGLDPNNSTDSLALEIKESTTLPGELEVLFNRIEDANLTYILEGSATLLETSWTALKTVSGTSAGPVITTQSVWPSAEDYFFRLKVEY
ncbi:LamG-like jellyroll fold domain-containing protein [Roseibacillus persicicus]|uniref:LamG-like jellyroll fold domain-containing protein n=1 Tax=Roseibacillus persicicus TaxID=454148 RepID=UPI00280F5288|nr:LamG-like jellyroll fold domain-containing protein [Roseibacillus persicicus]MDQ8190112.1 carbohydrate-binding protein [Roseibacillus persicicus]